MVVQACDQVVAENYVWLNPLQPIQFRVTGRGNRRFIDIWAGTKYLTVVEHLVTVRGVREGALEQILLEPLEDELDRRFLARKAAEALDLERFAAFQALTVGMPVCKALGASFWGE